MYARCDAAIEYGARDVYSIISGDETCTTRKKASAPSRRVWRSKLMLAYTMKLREEICDNQTAGLAIETVAGLAAHNRN